MQYMLLIYIDPQLSPDDREKVGAEYGVFSQGLHDRGAFVEGAPLSTTDTATTVRIRNGNRVVTDGPFAETKEYLGGYYIIEAPSLDAALEAAAMCPGSKYGSVEIRPVAGVPAAS
ncbi:MAG TPA: YciI family protein [Candidatus Elarobacter sp.]|jgi:hypothetical protein